MAEFDALDDASDDFASAVFEFLELTLALGIADLLENNLLGGLRIDTTQINGWQRIDDEVANHSTLLQLVGLL